jgi:hypothetical protein
VAAGGFGRYGMNRLEERYRRVLRLLPASYRRAWEEDMVATYLQSAQPADAEDAEFVADYGRPSWSEVASVMALAVRLRLGGSGAPPRYLAWGDAARRVALVGLLVHAVTALVGLGARLWSPAGFPDLVVFDHMAAIRGLLGLLWVAAYISLLAGWWRAARSLAILALTPAVIFFGADLAAANGAYLLSRIVKLLVDVVLVLALVAFHRQAVPVKPRPWLVALPVGVILLTVVLLLAQFSGNLVLLDWSSLICVAVIASATAYLAAPGIGWRGRTASWSTALALLALVALGLRVATMLDYLQFAAATADLAAMITLAVVEALAILAIALLLTVIARRELHQLRSATDHF